MEGSFEQFDVERVSNLNIATLGDVHTALEKQVLKISVRVEGHLFQVIDSETGKVFSKRR